MSRQRLSATASRSRADRGAQLADSGRAASTRMIDQRARRPARRAEIPQRAFHADALAELAARPAHTAHRDAVLLSLRTHARRRHLRSCRRRLLPLFDRRRWLVPHFEKMLYDNAQLIRLANWAYAETGEQLFRDRIEETIAWLLREMRVDGGGFAASLDADSDGEEGCSTPGIVPRSKPSSAHDAPAFFDDLHAVGAAWLGRQADPPPSDAQQQRRRSAARSPLLARLLAAREKRVRPGRDDKVLTDWNGLAIVALGRGRAQPWPTGLGGGRTSRLSFRCPNRATRRPAAAFDPRRRASCSRPVVATMPR